MPGLQPIALNVPENEWKAARGKLLRALNYVIKDIYEHLGEIKGIENKVFEPGEIILPSGTILTEHDHTSSNAGGNHPWADFVAADVTYLQSLVADIIVTNLLDKSSNETISGAWRFGSGSNYATFDVNGNLQFYGESSLKIPIETHTTDTILALSDLHKIHIFNSAGDRTCTLPSVSSSHLGRWVVIAKQGTGDLVIQTADADTIIDSTAGGIIECTTNDYPMQKIALMLMTSTEWHNWKGSFGVWSTR